MSIIQIAFGLCFLLAAVSASNYDNFIQQLAKRNQQLHEDHLRQNPDIQGALDDFYRKRMDAIQEAPDYEPESEEEEEEANEGYWNGLLQGLDEVRRFGNPEVPSQNNLWGEHKVSGGTGKGSQITSGGMRAKPEVKTDKLPAYCDPPNPCPIGMDPETAPSPCDKNIPDTKKFNKNWILQKMSNGECTCDREHMQSCSKVAPQSNRSMKEIRSGPDDSNPFFTGEKRSQVVAKKAPAMLNDPRKQEIDENPYLQGESLHSVIKKDGRNLVM